MFQVIFFIAVILLVLFITSLIVVGLCIGIAHLIVYFIPTIDLNNALVPAAILATVFIVMLASVFKFWITEYIKHAYMPLYDDEDEDNDEPEPEPPTTVTKIHSYRNKRNRRWK